MEEKPRLEVLTTPSNYDGVRLQVENLIVKNRDSFNFKMTTFIEDITRHRQL